LRADFDVVIAGGGYAGVAAARELGRLGAGPRVLLLDRRGRAGYPPASTSGIAGKWLREYDMEPRDGAAVAELRRFRLFSPVGERSRVLEAAPGLDADSLGVVLNEPNFLGRLEREAVADGVEVWHGAHAASVIGDGAYAVRVRVDGRDRIVAAGGVIAADGYNSTLGRQAGLTGPLPDDSFHGGFELTVPNLGREPDDEIRMYLGRDVAPYGYCWSFPAVEDGASLRRVGIGTPRSVPRPPVYWFGRFLARHPEYGGAPVHRVGGIIPTYYPPRRVGRERLLLAGDALRVCDPVTGGGIAPAIITGVEAARALAGRAEPVGTYRRRIGFLLRELRTRYVLKQLLYSLEDRELDRFIDLLADYPLPEAGTIDPFAERRRFTRYALRHGLGLFARLLYRGRLREALRPWV
jgi:digeranylgeranylglycerophospholipid reductase